MPDDLKAEALSKIHKQCIGCVEQYMKLLEYLDSMVTATFFHVPHLFSVSNGGVSTSKHNFITRLRGRAMCFTKC